MKRIFFKLAVVISLLFSISTVQAQENKINVYFFWGDGCPHCETQKPYLEELEKNNSNIKVHYFETWYNRENANLFQEVAKEFGTSAAGVPMTFIGTRNWIGFNQSMKGEMSDYINNCINSGCSDKAYNVIFGSSDDYEESNNEGSNEAIKEESNNEGSNEAIKEESNNEGSNEAIKEESINVFGHEISLGNMPLAFSTFIIAFIDGLNPCSLWVLAFLLGIVALTRDRKKIILIGLTYLGVAGLAYGAFILGMINVFSYVAHLRWVMIIVALIATLFGLVNVKDFFWYKKGISFTISDKHKPKLYQRVRNLMRPESNTKTLVIGAAVMALGITLIELPCTAGLPMLWSNIIATQNIEGGFFIFLFIIYILTYFMVELIIFLTVVFTLKISKFEEKQGRILKLVGGLIMLALAVILFFDLDILNNIVGTIVLFGSIIIVSLIITKVYDKYIGFEEEKNEK